MTTPTSQGLIADYLHRLRVAAEVLPPARAADLVDDISEHITAARQAGAVDDESAVTALLDRLGEPSEIVAAERSEDAAPPPVRLGLQHEYVALLLITLGSALPLIGWAVGVARLWSSKRFQLLEKLAGTLVFPGGMFGIRYADVYLRPDSCTTAFGQTTCEGGVSPWVRTLLTQLFLYGTLAVAATLWYRVRRRALAESGPGARGQVALPGVESAAVLLIAAGGFLLPVLGPLVGAALTSRSPRWSSSEKALALVLCTCSAVACAGGLVLVSARQLTASFVAMGIAYVVPLCTGLLLHSRLRRRRRELAGFPSYQA